MEIFFEKDKIKQIENQKRGDFINTLWDFDGTLFDTYPYLVRSFIETSGRDLDEKMVLEKLKISSHEAFRFFGIEENERKNFINRDLVYSLENSQPFRGVERVLAEMKTNVIVTHRDLGSTEYLLQKFDLLKHFEEIVSVEEAGFQRKPSADSYLYVAQKHRIHLVIGDRDLDLKPAREISACTVAFQNRSITADFYVNDYENFWDKIEKAKKKFKN